MKVRLDRLVCKARRLFYQIDESTVTIMVPPPERNFFPVFLEFPIRVYERPGLTTRIFP